MTGTLDNAIPTKRSPAFRLWFAVGACVLIALFAMTRRAPLFTSNFLLESNRSANGAEVLVDGKSTGFLSPSADGGAGSMLRLTVVDGQHVFAVRKEGFKPFQMTVNVQGEDYLFAPLERLDK